MTMENPIFFLRVASHPGIATERSPPSAESGTEQPLVAPDVFFAMIGGVKNKVGPPR